MSCTSWMAFNITNTSILSSDKSNFRPVRRVFTKGRWLFGLRSDSNWRIVREQVISCPSALFHPHWRSRHIVCVLIFYSALNLFTLFSNCSEEHETTTIRGFTVISTLMCMLILDLFSRSRIHYIQQMPSISLQNSECKGVNMVHMLLHNSV